MSDEMWKNCYEQICFNSKDILNSSDLFDDTPMAKYVSIDEQMKKCYDQICYNADHDLSDTEKKQLFANTPLSKFVLEDNTRLKNYCLSVNTLNKNIDEMAQPDHPSKKNGGLPLNEFLDVLMKGINVQDFMNDTDEILSECKEYGVGSLAPKDYQTFLEKMS